MSPPAGTTGWNTRRDIDRAGRDPHKAISLRRIFAVSGASPRMTALARLNAGDFGLGTRARRPFHPAQIRECCPQVTTLDRRVTQDQVPLVLGR